MNLIQKVYTKERKHDLTTATKPSIKVSQLNSEKQPAKIKITPNGHDIKEGMGRMGIKKMK